jgi:hypothetical protein
LMDFRSSGRAGLELVFLVGQVFTFGGDLLERLLSGGPATG